MLSLSHDLLTDFNYYSSVLIMAAKILHFGVVLNSYAQIEQMTDHLEYDII
jgi:hypothetical protein